MDVSVEGQRIVVFKSIPTLENSLSEQDRSQTRLMIIELRKYSEIGELLIENRTTGLQAQVSYRDVVRGASVTRAAVHMGLKEMGM